MGRSWGNSESNRNKIAALASTARLRALPPCLLVSSTVGPPVQPPSFRTSSLSLRTFLIAKRNIRNCRNSHLFNTLDFSNREKSHFHRFAASGPFLDSLPPCILASLIYTPKIRNRRKSRQISNLHFSNREKSHSHHLAAAGAFLASLPPCILASLISTP